MELLERIIQEKTDLIGELNDMNNREPPKPDLPKVTKKPKSQSRTVLNRGSGEALIFYDYRFKSNYGHYLTVLKYITKMADTNKLDLYHYKRPASVQDLKEFISKISKVYRHIYFYIYTMYPGLEIFNGQKLFNLPKVTFFLNFFPNNNQTLDGLNWIKKERISANPRVVLTSDNYKTIRLMNQKLSPVNNALYLPTPLLHHLPDPAMLKYRSNGQIRVGLVYNRQNPLKNTLIDFLKWSIPKYPKIHWEIIVNKLSDKDNLKRFLNASKEYSDRIHVHWDFLSSEEFEKFYQKINILIINYEKDRDYIYRTSGIVIEAIYYKVIVMTTKNNWLSKELEKFGAGVGYPKYDLVKIKKAFNKIVKDIKTFRSISDQKYDSFLKNYGVQNFYNRLHRSKTKAQRGMH